MQTSVIMADESIGSSATPNDIARGSTNALLLTQDEVSGNLRCFWMLDSEGLQHFNNGKLFSYFLIFLVFPGSEGSVAQVTNATREVEVADNFHAQYNGSHC